MPSEEWVWNEEDGKLQRVLHVLVVTCIDHDDGPLGVQRVGYTLASVFDIACLEK